MWHTVFSPCPDLCSHIRKKRQRSDEVQHNVHDYVQQKAQNYAKMLHNLMSMIQDYLLLTDDKKHCGALNSSKLVGSTAETRLDNKICIWLQEVTTKAF